MGVIIVRYMETAELVSVTETKDLDGYPILKERKNEVFVDIQSVRRIEFYDAMRTGLDLSIVFVVRACDYEGEKLINYENKRYKVERAYTKDGELFELNCSEIKGAKI